MIQLFVGLILTLLTTPAFIWAAHNYGWLDHPDERKHHHCAIPVVGGLAMSFAIAVCALWQLAHNEVFWGVFAATSIIVAIGFLDDLKGLPVALRFGGQGTAALMISTFAGVQLTQLGDLFGLGPVTLIGTLAVALTVFATVGMANALNLSDGMDGLAGGLALIAAVFLTAAAYLSGMKLEFHALLILGGSLSGFLFFNMRLPWQGHAKVFMGDSGSLMLGFLLGFSAVMVTQGGRNLLPPAAALWFFAIPLCDTVSLMLRRMFKGKSPFHPGRDHLHHILVRVGYSESQVVHFILLVAVVFALVGFLGWRWGVPDAVLFYGFLGLFAVYFAGVRHAWKLMRLITPLPNIDSRTIERPDSTTGGARY